jgi:hypothetical protein
MGVITIGVARFTYLLKRRFQIDFKFTTKEKHRGTMKKPRNMYENVNNTQDSQ